MIDALALLPDLASSLTYRVAGATHPKIAALDGESYRDMLVQRTVDNRVSDRIQFDKSYRSLAELAELIYQSSIVILPYDSPDQVTSGVLVDAIAAGRPVIATAFPHAVELLATGAGIVVPQRDPRALAEAIRMVLTQPQLAQSMAAEAQRLAPSLAWPNVAARYSALAEGLLGARSPILA